MEATNCKVKGQGPERQPWTARCQDCAWTSEVMSYRVAQRWAKFHRSEYSGHSDHRTVIRKGSEEETRDGQG